MVPTALQMGWCGLPTFFCAGSETARDVMSELVKGKTALPWYKFETIKIPKYLHLSMPSKPVNIIEVFVNDFTGATNNSELTHLLRLSLCMLHGIHAIFPPSEVTQYGGGEPVSEKKLNRGDGLWAYKKEIPGWMKKKYPDGFSMTKERKY